MSAAPQKLERFAFPLSSPRIVTFVNFLRPSLDFSRLTVSVAFRGDNCEPVCVLHA